MIKPVNNRILIQLIVNHALLIEMPQGVQAPLQKWLVIDTAPGVTCCTINDKLILHPESNILAIDDKAKLALIDASAVIAVANDEI